jgi:hypothetical protein
MEIRGVIPNEVQQAIREKCAKLTTDGRVVGTLLKNCVIGLSDTRAQNVLASIINHPQMQSHLRQYISTVSVNIYIMESQIGTIHQLRENLMGFQISEI